MTTTMTAPTTKSGEGARATNRINTRLWEASHDAVWPAAILILML